MKIPDSKFVSHHLISSMSETQIVAELKRISESFTSNRERIAEYVESPEKVSAYSCFYLPTNMPKLGFLFDHLPGEVKSELRKLPFVDMGTGPGTYLAAFSLYFEKNHSSLIGVDSSKLMLKQADQLLRAMELPMGQVSLQGHLPEDFFGGTLGFGNSLNELGLSRGIKIIQTVEPEFIFFIEPGTKKSWNEMKEMRTRLLKEGYQIIYPCPVTSKECPVKDKDWCHQVLRLVHHPETERLGQLASLDRKTMPMIAHFYSKRKIDNLANALLFRILRETKHSFEWQVCLEAPNELVTFEISKRGLSKARQKEIAKLSTGLHFEFKLQKKIRDDFWKVEIVPN